MFFIPYGHIPVKSKLRSDEIERRLTDQLEPPRIVSGMFRESHKYFQGSFENGEFKISRILNYRNSFRPVILGKLEPAFDHTDIELTLRLDYAVLAFMLFIFFSYIVGFLMPIFTLYLQPMVLGQNTEVLQYFPAGYWLRYLLSSLGGFSFFYLFIMIPFNIEANKAIKYLDQLFRNQRPVADF